MTRKSPPKATYRIAPWIALASCGCLLANGCSLFSPNKSSLSDYEEARQAINNPLIVNQSDAADGSYDDDAYRPEGVSAEKARQTKGVLSKLGWTRDQRANKELARQQFGEGRALYEQAAGLPLDQRGPIFRQAAEKFTAAAENWKSSSLQQDALFWGAESHFLAENYYQAEQVLAQLLKEYPRNPYVDHIDKRRFEIGDYWLQMGAAKPRPFFVVNFSDARFPWNDTRGNGKRVFERIRLDHPTGKISDDATMRLAVEQFRKGDFEGAADTFADVRTTYPDSEHQFNAQMLELESLMRSYQGALYSVVPLEESEKRVKQIVRQFPMEAEKQQQELNQTYAKIRFMKAERIWEYGEMRRKAQANSSAKYYYQKLVDEFSDTPYGEQSQVRLDELKDAPDDPPQYFRPLAKALGSDNTKPWEKTDEKSE